MASYLPTSYLPSGLQKRLLRSALSSLQLFDPTTLDLDSVDVSWGMQSTLELKGVGLDVHRMRTLLSLPDELHLRSAIVETLQVSIPADIHKTGIQVHISGIRAHGVLDSGSDSSSECSEEIAARSEILNKDKELLSKLPTVVDLAESFVEGQSAKERRRLVRSALKGFQDLDDSITSDESNDSDESEEEAHPPTPPKKVSTPINIPQRRPSPVEDSISDVDSDDGAAEVGMGTPLALPAFLAGFLKGVGDRVQITIRDVRMTLQVEPAQPKSPNELPQNPVFVELEVEGLDVEGVTAISAILVPEVNISKSEDGQPKQNKREGKRRIAMNRLKAHLVADESLFESPLTHPPPTAPSGDGAEEMKRSESQRSNSTVKSSGAPGKDSPGQPSTMASSVATIRDTGYGAPSRPTIPDSGLFGEDSQYGEASVYHDYEDAQSVFFEAQASDRAESSQAYDNCSSPPSEYDVESLEEFRDDASGRGSSDPMSESQMFADYEDEEYSNYSSEGEEEGNPLAQSVMLTRPVAIPGATTGAGDGAMDPRDASYSSSNFFSQSPESQISEAPNPSSIPLPPSTAPSMAGSIHSQSSSSSDDMTEAERRELSRSMLFSHEEAGSLYHSAMSGGPGESMLKSMSGRGEDESIPEEELEERLERLVSEGKSAGSRRGSLTGTPTKEIRRERTLRKNILDVQLVEVFVPAISEKVPIATTPPPRPPSEPSGDYSIHGQVPGAFSMYASSPPSSKSPKLGSSPGNPPLPPQQPPLQRTPSDLVPDKDIEVLVGKVSFRSDLGTGKLLFGIINTLANTEFPSKPTPDATSDPYSNEKPNEGGLEITIQEIEYVLVDQLHSVAEDSTSPKSDDGKEEEILLRGVISNASVLHSKEKLKESTQISLGKVFLRDSHGDDIFSFVPVSSRAVRKKTALLVNPDTDVSVVISKKPERTKITVETLCLLVTLRLDRVEELLAALGGFESVVGLANSVSTTKPTTWQKERENLKEKGVRWSDQAPSSPPAEPESTEQLLAFDATIGGLKVAIISKDAEAQVGLHTSAIKFSKRTDIKVIIDKVQAFGPDEEPNATNATVDHTRIDFLSRPNAEEDLPRLLRLLTPSKDRFGEEDDILVDTLLRQRRQGSVVRIVSQKVNASVATPDDFTRLRKVADDIVQIITVANFVAQDDRPGLLSFILARELTADLDLGEKIGYLDVEAKDVELAHVSAPMLVATSVKTIDVKRNKDEDLVGEGISRELLPISEKDRPVLMVRLVGDDPEPVIKVKLWNMRMEYHVQTVMDITDTPSNATTEELAANMVDSIADITSGTSSRKDKGRGKAPQEPSGIDSNELSKPLALNIALRDSVIALNPRNLPSRALVVLTTASVHVELPPPGRGPLKTTVGLEKANVFLVDNVGTLATLEQQKNARKKRRSPLPEYLQRFTEAGYVHILELTGFHLGIALIDVLEKEGKKMAEVDVRNKMALMQTCADSTQTLIELLSGLAPPAAESTEMRYCTEVMEVDVFKSICEDGLVPDFLKGGRAAVVAAGLAEATSEELNSLPFEGRSTDMVDDDVPANFDFVENFYGASSSKQRRIQRELFADDLLDDDLEHVAMPPKTLTMNEKGMLSSFTEQVRVLDDGPIAFQDSHFKASEKKVPVQNVLQKAETDIFKLHNLYKWDSDRQKKVPLSPEDRYSPLKIHASDINVYWYLHDGYDWQKTRDIVAKTVQKIESKAIDRRRARQQHEEEYDIEEESVIGDFLFNSIYIGIPANKDPRALADQINSAFDFADAASETNTFTSSDHETRISSLDYHSRALAGQKLRLHRSRSAKATIELKGVSADFVLFEPGSHETLCTVDLRVKDFEIVDCVPTSTWKYFLTYMKDRPREVDSQMVHLEVCNVKPVRELSATELVIRVTLLPLRLHVDQDTLDFITRFFEFKFEDSSKPAAAAPPSAEQQPFMQRVEVNSVDVKLDYKPKKVDYAGLRSGHTTEFMNFFILEESAMTMRHVILHGIAGMPALSVALNGTWMPDIKKTQLGPVLAGVAPVRSLVNLGAGVKDLVVVPFREYKRDGRIVRSLQQGAVHFATNTTEELIRLGAKVAIGTQTLLQSAEKVLAPAEPSSSSYTHIHHHDPDNDSDSDSVSELPSDQKRLISPYAEPPPNLRAGVSQAYRSLNRNFSAARDALANIPTEAREKGSVMGAAEAVIKNAPRAVIRPLVGVSEAVGKVALGAGNSLDREGKRGREVEDKYKRY